MSLVDAVVLGIVQGLTEFLPVSSSGHLLLLEKAMGLNQSGITFDVALHLGTLGALIVFFLKDLVRLFKALFVKNKESRLAWLLVLATVPAAIAGYLLESKAESSFRSPVLVAINLAVVGFLMLTAEQMIKKREAGTKLNELTKGQALAMGGAQALAVIPGISRSGSTITAGLFAGVDRLAATRFSFLLGVPIIAGAALKVLLSGSAIAEINDNLSIFVVGILTAFITGLLAIKFMLDYLAKHSLAIFAYYRIALATVVLIVLIF